MRKGGPFFHQGPYVIWLSMIVDRYNKCVYTRILMSKLCSSSTDFESFYEDTNLIALRTIQQISLTTEPG